MSSNNTGVLGIDYQEVSKVENNSDTDWMTFIKEDSDGLTRTGQKLLLLAIEEKVAGYNNVLTPATKGMKFGKNEDVNYVRPVESQ